MWPPQKYSDGGHIDEEECISSGTHSRRRTVARTGSRATGRRQSGREAPSHHLPGSPRPVERCRPKTHRHGGGFSRRQVRFQAKSNATEFCRAVTACFRRQLFFHEPSDGQDAARGRESQARRVQDKGRCRSLCKEGFRGWRGRIAGKGREWDKRPCYGSVQPSPGEGERFCLRLHRALGRTLWPAGELLPRRGSGTAGVPAKEIDRDRSRVQEMAPDRCSSSEKNPAVNIFPSHCHCRG